MPAAYNGLLFDTPLLARWAAFFDLAGWSWEAKPLPVGDWVPDFRVTFPCSHSECTGSHTLLASVLPVSAIEDFGRHPCLSHPYGFGRSKDGLSFSAGAALGNTPSVSTWEMSHGAGGGIETIPGWLGNEHNALWEKAGTMVKSLRG